MFGRLDPFSGVVDVGVGADGADDVTRRHLHVVGMLEDQFEDTAEVPPAQRENAGGVDVAVDGGMVGDGIVLGKALRAAPAEEILLDGLAVGMAADVAPSGMA